MKRLRYTFFITLWLILAPSLKAQVTIGSNSIPMAGALLDIKEQVVADGSADSKRGLMLPRVKMTTTTPVVGKLAESIGNTGNWDELMHTGLIVYNSLNTLDACTGGAYEGVYAWDGKKWLPLYSKEVPPPTDTSTDTFEGANCYILTKGGTIEIPIKRAFDIWNTYNSSSVADGKVLDKSVLGNLNGTLAASIVWQEAADNSSTDVVSTILPVSGVGSAASFSVTAGTKTGNALIRITVNGNVLWQWHVWVADSDPTLKPEMYNSGKNVYWFMDRNLGASTTAGTGAYGLYYQWGRNVPMPRSGALMPTIDATDSEKANLTTAIQSEKFMIYSNTISHDWYSPIAKQWDSRWGDMNTVATAAKSPFDPCPKGWRVASSAGDSSPWNCLDGNQNIQKMGELALSGYRSNGNGSLGDVGKKGYVWTATPNGALAGLLRYDGTQINPSDKFNRANAMSVRCIKEK